MKKMKIKVEYSESLQVSEGMWRKIGVEVEDEQPGLPSMSDEDFAHKTYKTAKEYVQKWHKEANPTAATNPNWDHKVLFDPPYNGMPLPVIDRSIERLEILIDDAKTREALSDIYARHTEKIIHTPSLNKLYFNKAEELSK